MSIIRNWHRKYNAGRKSHVVTNTSGDYSAKIPSYELKLTFVTMEDILGGQIGQNYVCYNPNLTKEQNERILRHAHMHHFKHIPMTEDDLDALTIYDKNQLNDFIKAYKEFLHLDD